MLILAAAGCDSRPLDSFMLDGGLQDLKGAADQQPATGDGVSSSVDGVPGTGDSVMGKDIDKDSAVPPLSAWAATAGGMSSEEGRAIAVDTAGNTYVTGVFQGTAAFGTSNITAAGYSDNTNVFITKLDPAGKFVWAVGAGGKRDDEGHGIAVDQSGNIYVTGYFEEQATFGSITLSATAGSSGINADIFVAKLDPAGKLLWATAAGGEEPSSSGVTGETGNDIAVDSAGNSHISGFFDDTASFGSTTLTTGSYDEVFVARLDQAGKFTWATSAGGNNDDRACGLALDAKGNCYVTGYYTGSASFGSIKLVSSWFGFGGREVFIWKTATSAP